MASTSPFTPAELSSTGNHDRESVLIIDGTLNDREYYADRLAPEYFVYMADSGKTGLDCFYANRIDCVVLELDLPDMSGFEVLVELVPVALRPTVPVIILTKLSNQMLTELAVKNGAQAGLHKVATSGDLLRERVFKAIVAVPYATKEQRELFKFSSRRTATESLRAAVAGDSLDESSVSVPPSAGTLETAPGQT